MSNYEDDWETSSGLALDGASGTITDFSFGYNNSIGAGVVCANMTFTPDSGDDDIEQSFSTGNRFEASRDGSELEGAGKINKNSTYGILIESVVRVLAEKDLSPGDVLGPSKVAGSWIGTRWTFGSFEKTTMNPSTKVESTSTKFIVTDYLGNADGDQPSGGKSKKAPAKKAASKGGGQPDGVSDDLWTFLLESAKNMDDHDEFASAMMEDEDVQASPAAQKAVMSTKAGSAWVAAGHDPE